MTVEVDPPEADPNLESAKETGRIEAFSDGVFSIAITLLVLELKVPHIEHAGNGDLWRFIASEWPSYFALLTSFATILIMWVHHHAIFRLARQADAPLLFANGFLLLMVTVVPFPTSVVASYLNTDAARAAAGFYAGVFFVLALSFQVLLRVVLRTCGLSSKTVTRLRNGYRLGPPAYLAAALAAFASAWLSLALCTALWIFWGVMAFRLETRDEQSL